MEQKCSSSNLVIKSFNGSYCVLHLRAWQKCSLKKCTSRNIWYKIFSSFRPLLLRHEHISLLSVCFSYTHWLLWKCQSPHQKPLLLWCVVAVPSKAPHYWLMEPHQHRSIKTQHQPHAVVSPGLSEPRLAVTHQGWRLLTSSIQKLMCSGGWRAITYITVNLLFKMLFYAWCAVPSLAFVYERWYTNKLARFPTNHTCGINYRYKFRLVVTKTSDHVIK